MKKIDAVIYILVLVFAFGSSTVAAQEGEIKQEIARVAKVKAHEFVSQFKMEYRQCDQVGDWLEDEWRDWLANCKQCARLVAAFDKAEGELDGWRLFRRLFIEATERDR